MRLTLQTDGTKNLAEELAAAGFPLDLRCGGSGTCGRCRVILCSGEWECDGKPVTAPAEVKACRTRLTGAWGEVEIPERSLAVRQGQAAAAWSSRPLPESGETVIAVDLGTTTVAAVKLRRGRIVRSATCFNRQSRFGDNVITRINHAGSSPEGLEELRRAAADSVNELLTLLDPGDAARIALAGNTVMSCLFHGIDPASIGVMPFTPPCRIFPERTAAEAGLAGGSIPVLTVPAIAGYVGGDLTAGLCETPLQPGEMLVDIGTNCEIILRSEQGYFCTAAAAGPAFEGAGILCGCRAVPGAIDHYTGRNACSVIGGGEPIGLCGSAMIDFLTVERREGRLNEFGRIQPPADHADIAPGVAIHEWEIEQLLKAKAAVRAGIQTLADHCRTPVKKIFLAGGFARYLNLGNAVACGLLPECELEAVGNTSLGGAVRLALSPGLMEELTRLIDLPREIPLNTLPEFEDNFIDGLLLP